ncbi:hypothetical protein QE152_g34441 [Popillia japonica]|uniref:Uncharacterized protein n=1 Tax=Popillia japonica TaxID=7064 RepID=A0AAW1ITY5_POPJA
MCHRENKVWKRFHSDQTTHATSQAKRRISAETTQVSSHRWKYPIQRYIQPRHGVALNSIPPVLTVNSIISITLVSAGKPPPTDLQTLFHPEAARERWSVCRASIREFGCGAFTQHITKICCSTTLVVSSWSPFNEVSFNRRASKQNWFEELQTRQ